MKIKETQKNEFSNEVNEKISTVFQNFAVNPLNKNVDDRIAHLENRIFETNKNDPSLKDTIIKMSSNTQRTVYECCEDLKSKLPPLEELEDLQDDMTSTKNIVITNQSLIKENQNLLTEHLKSKELFLEEMHRQNDIFSQGITEQTKSINASLKSTEASLIKSNDKSKAEILEGIKNSNKELKGAVNNSNEALIAAFSPSFNRLYDELSDTKTKNDTASFNITKLINSSSEALNKNLNTTENNLTSSVNNAVITLTNQINEIIQTSDTLCDSVEELKKKNQALKTMLISLLAVNGTIAGVVIAILLLTLF